MGLGGASTTDAAFGLDLGRGAIVGALVVAAAYLTGLAVFRRGAAAVFALLMVLAAGALQFVSLGLLKPPSEDIVVLLQGLFGAAAIVFLSAVIKSARNNALLGGLMFAAALTLVGIGVINLVTRGDASGLMRSGLVGVGVFAVILAGLQARRETSARLILPGAALALAAPVLMQFLNGNTALAFLPEALFTIGVLVASFVALAESAAPRSQELGFHGCGAAQDHHHQDHSAAHQEALRVSENQLAQVLDYAGVSVWDWCPHGAHQTDGLPSLMGADSRAPFTPEALRHFVHKDDLAKFDKSVTATGEGDGRFDVELKLHDGRHVRLRGARAVDTGGELERVVCFVEKAVETPRAGKEPAAAKASPAVVDPLAGKIAAALEKGEIGVVFQPIVALGDGKIAGYEALARWRGDKANETRAGAEDLVRAAEAAGKGGALAELVLNAAASHLAAETKSGEPIFVAMNLSFAQMRDPGFLDALKKAIAEHNLPLKSIVLELTESQAITDEASASAAFRKLRLAGAALAFDDFGAGFSSLSNLHKFAFDYLKIDKSFIEALAANSDGAKIARAVAGLARDLGLTVIAEGVETKALAEAARAIGCTLGQGFAFGEPDGAGVAAPISEAGAPVLPEGPGAKLQQRRRMFVRPV